MRLTYGTDSWAKLLKSASASTLLLVAMTGCSSDPVAVSDAPSASEPVAAEASAEPVATVVQETTAASATVEVAEPLDPAAVAAFEKLTTPNVSSEEWDAAHQQLIELGEKSAPVLVRGLSSDEPMVREIASSSLVLLGPETFAPHASEMAGALNDPSEFVRANIASALILSDEQADQALTALIQLLDSSDTSLRHIAALNLRTRPQGVVAHLPAISAHLQSEQDANVVVALIELVGDMGTDAGAIAPELRRLAAMSHPEISQSAASALTLVESPIQQTQAEFPSLPQ
ncbi:MAG: hypothetical protein KDA66_06160 [Planctomycetaceae bacterium]|nr:hypothetical protein [Planctomycetaceae bacterium]